MKRIASAAALTLLLSCATSDGVIDQRTLECTSGQDVSIDAGFDGRIGTMEGADDRFDLVVEVSNNSHEEVTVSYIRADQMDRRNARYAVDRSYRKFDQVIEEGKDHAFRLPMTGRALRYDPNQVSFGQAPELAVTVALSNGDSYRCFFSIPASR